MVKYNKVSVKNFVLMQHVEKWRENALRLAPCEAALQPVSSFSLLQSTHTG